MLPRLLRSSDALRKKFPQLSFFRSGDESCDTQLEDRTMNGEGLSCRGGQIVEQTSLGRRRLEARSLAIDLSGRRRVYTVAYTRRRGCRSID